VLRDKMEEWLTNGAQLARLIDPEARTVEIYRLGLDAETRGSRFLRSGRAGGGIRSGSPACVGSARRLIRSPIRRILGKFRYRGPTLQQRRDLRRTEC